MLGQGYGLVHRLAKPIRPAKLRNGLRMARFGEKSGLGKLGGQDNSKRIEKSGCGRLFMAELFIIFHMNCAF